MAADTGLPIPEIKVDGGASVSRHHHAVPGGHHGQALRRPIVRETTALGAAYLAGLAVGCWRSLDEVRDHWTIDRVYEPSRRRSSARSRCASGRPPCGAPGSSAAAPNDPVKEKTAGAAGAQRVRGSCFSVSVPFCSVEQRAVLRGHGRNRLLLEGRGRVHQQAALEIAAAPPRAPAHSPRRRRRASAPAHPGPPAASRRPSSPRTRARPWPRCAPASMRSSARRIVQDSGSLSSMSSPRKNASNAEAAARQSASGPGVGADSVTKAAAASSYSGRAPEPAPSTAAPSAASAPSCLANTAGGSAGVTGSPRRQPRLRVRERFPQQLLRRLKGRRRPRPRPGRPWPAAQSAM